jgi:hypothetical protein
MIIFIKLVSSTNMDDKISEMIFCPIMGQKKKKKKNAQKSCDPEFFFGKFHRASIIVEYLHVFRKIAMIYEIHLSKISAY